MNDPSRIVVRRTSRRGVAGGSPVAYHLVIMTTKPFTLDELMFPEAWELMGTLSAPHATMTAKARASRAASTLYSLGLATNPDSRRWRLTPRGVAALRTHAAGVAQ